MHSIFPVFIIFSSYRSFLFPGYTFPVASFGWGPGDCGLVLQGFFLLVLSLHAYFMCPLL